MDQIEEFDSTSSSSSASSASESSSNESSEEEEEGDSSFGEAGEGDVSDSQEDDNSASEIRIAMAGGAVSGSSTVVASHGPRSSYQIESSETMEGGRKRKRLRKRKATGLRKKLRTHIESVDEFNPEARSAQSAELERLRRLQLQQSLTASIDQHQSVTPQPLVVAPTTYAGQIQPQAVSNISAPSLASQQQIYMSSMQEASIAGPSHVQSSSSAQGGVSPSGAVNVTRSCSDNSSSPEVLMVDLTYTAKMGDAQRRVEDAIVIDSGSDSDNTNNNEQGHPQVVAKQQSSGGGGVVASVVPTTTQFGSSGAPVAMPTRSELLNMKYGEIRPSPDGRVLVNAGHASQEEDIYLAPQIARAVKPHQIGGIRFLYDNIVESLTRFNSSPGFGCILAHSMGLGKTLQVIGFIEVFFRCTPAKHVLCVVPVNTLQNWIGEFEHWVPPPPPTSTTQSNHSSSSSGVALLTNQNPLWGQMTTLATKATPLAMTTSTTTGGQSRTDEVRYRTFNISILSEANRTMDSRLKVIREWRSVGGVLLLGYEMYRLLSLSVPSLGGNKMAVKKKKSLVVKTPAGGTIDLDETEREMEALIEIQKALCNPGPDLVVCDEGHRIKNDYSNISQALKRIRTRRRIVMTGYPLQNNLTEYWCMVDFVRPNLLGTKQEFADLFERPITNGQCVDSTPMDVRLMRYRSHVLHSLLEGFVLRKGHEILKSTLPPKFEHVLYLRPSQVQADLYNFNMSAIAQAAGNANSAGPLKAFAVCSKIWNHPDIYYQEAMSQKRSKTVSPTSWLDQEGLPKTLLSGTSTSSGAKGSSSNESTCKIDWPSSDIPNYQPGVLENSPKMLILAELVDRSVQLGDKILIFSQSLNTLSYIEKLLTQRHIPIPNSTNPTGPVQYSNVKWTKSKNYCRLDGSTNSIERDRLINNFNAANNHDCWVFLLSTKAGCLGINLIGANRVIVTDVSWNPCYDSQAVCRVYRYGQTKPCYIYRLVCDGTMERKIYDRQISKQSMSNRVVDELHPERHLTTQDILKLITPLAQLPPPSDLSPHASEYLIDPLLMEICSSHGQLLTKLPFKHESLLLDSEEERMTDVEKYLAMKGFQQHLKLIRSNPNNQQSGQGGGGYRPQPTGQTSLPRPQASQLRPQAGQARPQTGQTRPQTGQTGQMRATQQGSRPFPQIPGLQVPIPPVPEATPSTSGLMKRGSVMVAPVLKNPNEKVEVICLDSDEDDNGDNRPVAVTRGEIPLITAANDPISLLQSPTHLQAPSLSSQFPSSGQIPRSSNDPLPDSLATSDAGDPLPASSSQPPPTSSTHTDSSSALNLNTSFNNSIPSWIDLLMAVTEDAQQRNLIFQAANQYLQETGSYSQQPVAMVTSSDDAILGQTSQVVPDVAANVNVFSDVAMCTTLQSFIQAQGSSSQQVTDGQTATTAASESVSSCPPLTSSMSAPPLFQSQQSQVYGTATPHSSLPTSSTTMSSTPTMTSSVSGSSINPSPLLSSQCQVSQVRVKLEHSPNSVSACESPPPSNTFHANKSPSVSPIVQSSPSQYTPSPSYSSSSLSPPSPHHQTPQSLINKTSESSNTCTLSVNVPTCSSSGSTLSPASLKLKRSKSHSAPVRHLAPSPLRKTQSSSLPNSYSLGQKFNSSLLNDDSSTTGARSTSASPTSTLSPSQTNSSDCNSPPEQPSKPQNESPPTRLDSSVTFRYSSSPSPSNTPSAPYTPCSIPLLSPVAARLLFLSTGTQLPSSPPEDVDKLPPIVNRKPVIKKEGHGCTTNLASVLKKEPGSSSTQRSLLNITEKKHHSDKKKRKGSSLAKSMELVPMSTDITAESFFTSSQVTPAPVTTPTSVPPMPPPSSLTSQPKATASSSCVTTPSPMDPPPMLCTPLPLRRNSSDSLKKELSTSTVAAATVSPTATTTANLWALKSQPQLVNHQPISTSHTCSPEHLLSSILKMTSSSKSLTSGSPQYLLSTPVSGKGSSVSTALVSASDSTSSTCAVQSNTLAPPLISTSVVPAISAASSHGPSSSTASITKLLATSSVTKDPKSSTVPGSRQGSAFPPAAVYKNAGISVPSLSQSKTTLPLWSNTSQQCTSVQSMSSSSTPVAVSSSSRDGASQLKGVLLSRISPSSSVVSSATSTARVSKAQCTLAAAPPQHNTALPQQMPSSTAQNIPQNVGHNGVTSPILSVVQTGTSTSTSTAFQFVNSAMLSQAFLTSAQQQNVAQYLGSNGVTSSNLSAVLSSTPTSMFKAQCNGAFPPPNAMLSLASNSSVQRQNSVSSNGVTSPTLSSAYSTGVPALASSYLDTNEVNSSHAQNHHPATSVAMTTVAGAANMSADAMQSSVQSSTQAAHYSSCSSPVKSSALTTTAASSSAETFVVDASATMLINLLPDGLEHRVVSGLLHAEPPITLRTIQDNSVHKPGVKSEAPAMTSSGYGVVTDGGVAHTAASSASSSCGHRPCMKNSSSSSGSCDSNLPLHSSASVNSSKPPNTSPPYTKSKTTNCKLVATKPGPLQLQSPPLSSTSHSVAITRPSTLTVSSTQASSSVLSSPAVPTNQLPSLNSRRNSSSLEMPMGGSNSSQASMAAVNGDNMNGVDGCLNSEYVGALILSPSQLLSPSLLQSPPGSTTLPDPLKTFVFPISLSPPIERKQLSTPSAQNEFLALQSIVTPKQLKQEKQLPVQSSLKSPDHRQRNNPMLSTNQQQSQGPLLSPIQQRSSAVHAPSPPQINGPQKSGSVLSANYNLQRSGPNVHQRSSPILASSPQKSGSSLSGGQQRNSTILAHDMQRSSSLLSPTKQSLFSGNQRRTSPVTVHNSQRSIAPKPQQRNSPVVVPSAQKNGWDMMQTLLLSPDNQRSSSAPSQSNQHRDSIISSPNAQRNGTSHNMVSPSSHVANLMLLSTNQRSSPVVSPSQQSGNAMHPSQVNYSGLPPANNKTRVLVSPTTPVSNYSMPSSSTQQRSSDMFSAIFQMSDAVHTPPASHSSYSTMNGCGLLPDTKYSSTLLSSTTSQMSKPVQSSNLQRSSAVLPSASQTNVPSLPTVNNNSNTMFSPTVLTSPVPFSSQQVGAAMLFSPNSLMSSHGTSSDGANLLSSTSQGVPSYNQQKSSTVFRRKSVSSDQSRNGTILSPELQRNSPSLSQKSQGVSPVVVPNGQKKISGKSSTDKKKSNHRKLSRDQQKKTTVQVSNNRGSGNVSSCSSQPTAAANNNLNQRSSASLLPNLDSQRISSTVPLNHQRSSPLFSSSSPELQRSNGVPLSSQQSGTLPVSLPSYQRSSPVVQTGSSPLLSPDYLKHSTMPSSNNQQTNAAVSLPNPQRTGTVLPPILSPDAQRSNAFSSSSNQRTSVAVSLPNSRRNDAALSFSPDHRHNAVLSSSSHQMSSSPTLPVLPSYQSATASLHRANAALVNTQQKSSTSPMICTSPNTSNSRNGLASIPNSISVTTCNRRPPPPHTSSPTTGNNFAPIAINSSGLTSPAQSFTNGRATTTHRNGSTSMNMSVLSSAISTNSGTSITSSGGFASTPQGNSVANSNGLASTPHLVSSLAVPNSMTPVLQHPQQALTASLSLQQTAPLPQSGSASINPSWDTADLSFLSDLFAPQPPPKLEHHSESSLSKHPQTPVSLPSMGGDQLINELLATSQNQNSVSNHPQASMNLPNVGEDTSSIINDLLMNSQTQNSVPKYPQTSVNQPSVGGEQVIRELLGSSSVSQNASRKQLAVRPQSLANGQRSNSSAIHPLMRVSSPTILPQQQQSGPPLPKQQRNGTSLAQQQQKGPQNIHSWQQQNGSLQTLQQCHPQQNDLLSQQQQNGPLPQYQQSNLLPQEQNGSSQLHHSNPSSQNQQNGRSSQNHQNGPISQSSTLPQHQQNAPLPQQQQSGLLLQHQQNSPLPQQQQNTLLQQNGLSSQNGMMLWQQRDQLSTNHTQSPLTSRAAVSSPHMNSPGLVQPVSSNVLQSPQLDGFQNSPVSSTYSSQAQGQQLQQLLSPTQAGLPSLPKLTPLPSQASIFQSLPTVSTPQRHVATGLQQTSLLLGGCADSRSTPLSATSMQSNSMELTSNSVNLLSILNSLSPSQLESLLSSAQENQSSPMPLGNGRQGTTLSSIGDVPIAVSHSQSTLASFQNQNFGSSIPPNLPIPHPTPAADYRESLASYNAHQLKPKVTQVNKTAASAPLPQFTVRSSCTSTELRGQVLQFEPAAVMQAGYNSNATAGSVSALRLHSGQIN